MTDNWDLTPSPNNKRRRIEQILDKDNSSSTSKDNTSSSSSSSNTKNSKKTSSSSKSKTKADYSKSYKKATISVPKYRYGMPNDYSVSRVGLEVYETNDDAYVPYVPKGSVSGVGTTTVTDDSIDSEDEDNVGFSLHMGEVLKTYYLTEFEQVSFESDYKEMTDSGTLTLDSVDLKQFYKGVRVQLMSEWDDYEDEFFIWDYFMSALKGFITEQTFSENTVEVQLSGMTKTLDMKYNFDFKQMLRSEIINQVILTAGLKPFINVDGLTDDITDFKNYSESGSDSSTMGGEGETIDNLVKKIVGDESNSLKKAKLIHKWLQENVRYGSYSCSNYSTPEECLKNKSHLNCADTARLTRAMMASAGLNCYVVHRTTNGGHFWTIIEIDGKKYASDQTGSGSAFNTVWKSSGRTSVNDGGSYTRKNGKNPDC